MRKIFLLTLLFFSFSALHAQYAVNAGGKTEKEGNLTLSYSIGQTFTQSFSTYGGLLKTSPGVQQAYLSRIVSTIQNTELESGDVKLFPNPAFDHFNLSISGIELFQARLTVYDLHGKVLAIHPIESLQTHIDLTDYPTGIYVVRVVNSNKELKFFKVVKN